MKKALEVLYTFYRMVMGVNRLRELRISHGMKQEDLSKRLNIFRTAISKYELGQLDMSSATICALCDIFGCTADYLLGRAALPSSDLTPEEEELLLAWRAADDHDRAIVATTLARYKQDAAIPSVTA